MRKSSEGSPFLPNDSGHLFLTADQLQILTGRRRPGAQLRWLRQQGIEAVQAADGRVVVAESAVLRRLGIRTTRRDRESAFPDWAALNAS